MFKAKLYYQFMNQLFLLKRINLFVKKIIQSIDYFISRIYNNLLL